MRIALGCDHRGFHQKRYVVSFLKKAGHDVVDFGCENASACDYPDFAAAVANAVAGGDAEVGVLLDGSGIGMSIAANKIVGIRAALVHDEVTARLAREYNHCNVLCIGTDLISSEQLRTIVQIFLSSSFAAGRHVRRVEKVAQIEADAIARSAIPRQHARPPVVVHKR